MPHGPPASNALLQQGSLAETDVRNNNIPSSPVRVWRFHSPNWLVKFILCISPVPNQQETDQLTAICLASNSQSCRDQHLKCKYPSASSLALPRTSISGPTLEYLGKGRGSTWPRDAFLTPSPGSKTDSVLVGSTSATLVDPRLSTPDLSLTNASLSKVTV